MNQENMNTVNRLQLWEMLRSSEDGTTIPLLVTGTSMLPFLLNRRSVVYLEKNSHYVPAKRDVVFFIRQDQTFVLHRIVGIKEDGTLVIKGDAQSWREEIHPGQILAHVTYICRKKRKFSVENKFYRCMVRLWLPFRVLHPFVTRCMYLAGRVPYKLSRRYREKHS